MSMNRPDYLIVGGGSAGATLASRLSEDPATRVLLVEAGIDTPPDAVPADVADTFPSSSLNKSYFWSGLECTRSAGGATRPFPQARIMGGGSSVMGLWALRGVPSDFDAWTAAGAEGWGWGDVVRFYRRLEGDQDRDHSQMRPGPYKIRRTPAEEWPGFVTGDRARRRRYAASVRSTTSTRTRSMASSRSRSRRTTTGGRRARAAISPATCGGVPILS